MFNSQKLLLLISLTSALLLSPATAQTYCDPNNRPTSSICQFNQPVCAYYTDDCPFELCSYKALNPCDACKDPRVSYHKDGDCTEGVYVETDIHGFCGMGDIYYPVCGGKEKDGQKISKTFRNRCKLCRTSKFEQFHTGACLKDRTYCNQGEEILGNDPVCGLINVGEGLSYVTIPRRSEACVDPIVQYFMEGECGQLWNDRVYCLPNNRPEQCAADYAPVCAYYRNEQKKLLHKTLPNPCSACAESGIIYHQPGPCEQDL